MQRITKLIKENQKWLIRRAIAHAQKRGYTNSTSKLERAWRLSIEGLSNSIIKALNEDNLSDWRVDEIHANDTASLFATSQAHRHRSMGIQLGMFLGLMKCYHQSFLDLIWEHGFEADLKEQTAYLITSFFDLVEVKLSQEWINISENQVVKELHKCNREIIADKNKYQTIFESLHNPVLVLDSSLNIVDQNYTASKLFQELGFEEAGFGCQMKKLSAVLPWLSFEVEQFRQGAEFSVIFEKRISNSACIRNFAVKLTRLLDAAEDYTGIVLILRDITESKRLEDDLRRRLEFEETVKRISSRFVGVHDIVDAINLSMADLGKFCRANQAYLFSFRKRKTVFYNKNLQNISISDYPWWKEKIWNNHMFMIRDVARLPKKAAAEKRLLENLNVNSLLVLAFYLNGVPSGFIGLANLQQTEWNEEELILLRRVTEIITNALERHQFEEKLKESEASYRTIFENTGTATIITEENSMIVLANDEFTKLSGFERQEIEGAKSWTQFFCEETVEKMITYHSLRRRNDPSVPNNYEAQFKDKSGNTKHVLVHVAILPGKKQSIFSLTDISAKKNAENKLKYLSYHDFLTGLFNRTYFEEEFSRLEQQRKSVGVIVCDLDGLKLTNDTAGHNAGDAMLVAASKVLKSSIRADDVLARIGGDEFAILLPDCSQAILQSICLRIKRNLARHNKSNSKLNINMSLGYSLKTEESKSLSDVFKEADDNMYKEKLHNNQSRQGQIINTLSKAIEARDFITGGHAERLHEHVTELACKVGIKENELADLRLFAKFHDIGKVGIPDRILFKREPLTKKEMYEMRRHSEIGYRIACTSPDLLRIADWILKHHEWWNGSGYPLGLKGHDIPLECRILSIVDAYDAMTCDRPYRKAMSHALAVKELRRYSGVQFDPELVELFIGYITDKLSAQLRETNDLELVHSLRICNLS